MENTSQQSGRLSGAIRYHIFAFRVRPVSSAFECRDAKTRTSRKNGSCSVERARTVLMPAVRHANEGTQRSNGFAQMPELALRLAHTLAHADDDPTRTNVFLQ